MSASSGQERGVQLERLAAPTPKKAERIADQLRRKIVRHELPAGSNLPSELELIGQFGVSRATVREALRILESESLLRVNQGSRLGAEVCHPDGAVAARYAGLVLQVQQTTLADVFEARLGIEPMAARLATQRRDPGSLQALEDLIGEEAQALHDPARYANLSVEFHTMVVHASGNQTLALFDRILHEILQVQAHRVAARFGTPDPTVLATSHRSHSYLVKLLRDGRADRAEAHWRAHLAGSAPYLHAGTPATVVDLFDD